jgi:hypothetical protein
VRARFEGALEQAAHLLKIEGLTEVVESPAFHRLDRGFGRAVGGQENDRTRGVRGPDPVEEIEPRPVQELKVQHDHVRLILLDSPPAFRNRARGTHLDVAGGEDPVERLADQRLIVNDQQFRHATLLQLAR